MGRCLRCLGAAGALLLLTVPGVLSPLPERVASRPDALRSRVEGAHLTDSGASAGAGTVGRPSGATRSAGRPRVARLQPRLDVGCKPRGPVLVDVNALSGDAQAGRLRFDFAVEPQRDFSTLAWALELPDGTSVHSGSLGAAIDPSHHQRFEDAVELSVSPGVAKASELELVVTGTFGAGAEVETVQVRRRISWGDPQVAAPERERIHVGVDTGRSAVVPTRHRAGR